jgi:hypothetical protein
MPMLWCGTDEAEFCDLASGTKTVLASGVILHGNNLEP